MPNALDPMGPKLRGILDPQDVTNLGYRGLLAESLGAPVDIMSTIMQPFGYKHPSPVMGSEWIKNKMDEYGVTKGERHPMQEMAASMLIPDSMDAARLVNVLAPSMLGMVKAYHGTPHNVDKFRLDKIGTGEGAQAYGHGLYFAENPDIANHYKRMLNPDAIIHDLKIGDIDLYKGGQVLDYSPPTSSAQDVAKATLAEQFLIDEWKMKEVLRNEGESGLRKYINDVMDSEIAGYMDEAKEYPEQLEAAKYVEELKESFNKNPKSLVTNVDLDPGNVYNVKLDVNKEDLLDWDAPLSEQPESFKKLFEEIADTPFNNGSQTIRDLEKHGNLRVDQIYDELSRRMGGQEAASAYLKSKGIPGIQYFDGMSRNVAITPEMKKTLDLLNKVDEAKDPDLYARLLKQYETQEAASDAARKLTRNFVIFDEDLIDIVK